MSNELSTLQGLSQSKFGTDDATKAVSSSGKFLPYLKLCGSTNKFVKNRSVGMGNFAIVDGDNITDIGDSIVGLFFSWRPKAIDYDAGGEVQVAYDPASALFKKISTEDGQSQEFGPEFLVWLPEQEQLVTYHLGNATGRRESPKILGPMKANNGIAALRVNSKYIETKKYSWHGPEVHTYDGPIESPELTEEMTGHISKFNNPPAIQGPEDAKESDRE